MNVNIAVCGKFHQVYYARYLNGYLGKLYYSHKWQTNAARLGVDVKHLENLWLKEYLLYAHMHCVGYQQVERWLPWYHDLWETQLLWHWQRSTIFHFLLHGTCRRAIARAKREGSLIVGEPVNSHPEHMNAILNEEYERLGMARRLVLSVPQQRAIAEAQDCDYLLVASQFVGNSYKAQGFPAERIHRIPYGVDLGDFRPSANKRSEKTFRAICVGQVSARKGQVYLLEAWKRLNLPDAELLLVGILHAEMQPILDRYAGYFRHIPHIPRQELHDYLSQSAVFVLPTLEDGFSNVIGEAMACGLPTITTPHNGAAELIEHGTNGFIMPVRSVESLMTFLEELYRDPERRRAMAEAALHKSRTCLSWETYARSLTAFYQACVTEVPL